MSRLRRAVAVGADEHDGGAERGRLARGLSTRCSSRGARPSSSTDTQEVETLGDTILERLLELFAARTSTKIGRMDLASTRSQRR